VCSDTGVEIIIVAPCPVPLVIGGAERLWWGLLDHLNRHTPHVADIIKLPGAERDFSEVIDSYRRFSQLDLRNYDLVISSKYPGWMTEHPNHVCYMLHPLRGLYDTYPRHLAPTYRTRHPEIRALLALVRGADLSRAALAECFERVDRLTGRRRGLRLCVPVPAGAYAFPGPLIREIVHFCDRVAFRSIRRFSAISRAVASRPGYFPPGAKVTPVHPAPNLTSFHPPRDGSYFFTVSRLDHPKRVDLLIEATKALGPEAELRIAGTGPDEPRLREIAGADARIRFLGFVNDEALLDLYADARAVLFVPFEEDFGLVTLEAMMAGKPVITASDSGGAAELVSDGKTGLIADPNPDSLARAMAALGRDPELATAMGARARERAAEVTWERVCGVLLDGLSP
jgi:glycosyltransferase involved in cell wall biosynthesis